MTAAPCCEVAIHMATGATFAAMLRADLTGAEWSAMRALNASPDFAGSTCCASHNFRDANVYMADAFAEIMGAELDGEREDHCEVWNRAWSYAKAEFLTGLDPFWTVGAVEEYANGFLATVRHSDGPWAVLQEHDGPLGPDGGAYFVAFGDLEAGDRSWCIGGEDEDATFPTLADAVAEIARERAARP